MSGQTPRVATVSDMAERKPPPVAGGRGFWSGRRRWAVVAVAAAVLLLGGVAGWYWWPRQVAPGLTPEMVNAIDWPERNVSVVGGGSRRDAHTLWVRYHARQPEGTPPESP